MSGDSNNKSTDKGPRDEPQPSKQSACSSGGGAQVRRQLAPAAAAGSSSSSNNKPNLSNRRCQTTGRTNPTSTKSQPRRQRARRQARASIINLPTKLSTMNSKQSKTPMGTTENMCSGCQRPIKDRYLLSACDKFWHDQCLKCDRCQAKLGELGSSLYQRANMNLCRQDYMELFGQKAICAVCDKLIYASEMVMRARDNVYHLECFACQLCGLRFCIGDRFHLCDNKIVCQYDYDEHICPMRESLFDYDTGGGGVGNSISFASSHMPPPPPPPAPPLAPQWRPPGDSMSSYLFYDSAPPTQPPPLVAPSQGDLDGYMSLLVANQDSGAQFSTSALLLPPLEGARALDETANCHEEHKEAPIVNTSTTSTGDDKQQPPSNNIASERLELTMLSCAQSQKKKSTATTDNETVERATAESEHERDKSGD